MEPWQLEEMRSRRLEAVPLPRCVCCGERITTEQYLDLERFGLKGCGCQRCVDSSMGWTEQFVMDI